MRTATSSFLLFFCLISFLSFGQGVEKDDVPNYIKRNNDFISKRATTQTTNFAEFYYSSFKNINSSNLKNKKVNEWTPLGPFGYSQLAGMGRINSIQFHPTDTNCWLICVAQGGVWKTTNAGNSWTSISGDLPILRTSYLSVHPTNPDIMYIALGDYAYLGHNLQANENKRNSHYGLGIYKTTNGGISWNATGLSFMQTDFEGSLIAKVMINENHPDTVIAVGQTGSFVTKDGGINWTKTNSKLFWDLEKDHNSDSVLYASTGYVHAYGIGEAGILKSTDFGETWIELNSNIPKTGLVQRIELAVAPSDYTCIYAIACDTIGGFYGFYQSTNGGSSFSLKSDYTYQYNILNWRFDQTPGGQGRYDLAIAVDKYDKNKVTIGGVNIWQTSNGGSSFAPVSYWTLNYQNKSVHADIHEIIQHPVTNSYFVCHDGGLTSADSIIQDTVSRIITGSTNTQWSHYTQGLNITSFYRLSINQDNGEEILAGAQDNSTVFTEGTSFYNISGGDGMESKFDDANYYRYTSSQNGRIYAFLTLSGSFDYEGSINPPNGEYGEWTTPFVSANDKLYVLYGNLYSYEGPYLDAKHSNFNLAPGTAMDAEEIEGEIVFVAKRGYASYNIPNQIYATSNAGSNWSNIGAGLPNDLYPSYIELNQSNPQEAWITFSGFDSNRKIYHTSNLGQNWTNITYNLPNIPVNCVTHQNDSSNYIYIGTDLGVFYMHKDSSSWNTYNSGLPNVIVSELEVNEANNTLVAATFGRGLWEVELLKYVRDTSTNYVNPISTNTVEVKLSPNPANDQLHVIVSSISNEDYSMKLIDICGKTLIEKNLSLEGNSTIDISSFLSGEYFLVLTSKNGRIVKRFIKL
jgi:photosystem II stability/assembly factor-like uncharacterized protein